MKKNIPETIGVIVSLGGVVVMAGWLLGIELLKSDLPGVVTMKFSTALSFFLSGIMLCCIARFQKKKREWTVIIIPILSMTILLLMTSPLAATVLGIASGVDEMFVRDTMTAVGSVTPGRPSIATMINFILIAMTGILTALDIRGPGNALNILGVIVAMVGLSAIAGYSTGHPLLYFAVPAKSGAMALNTAVLFTLWGVGGVLTKRNN